MNDKAEGKDKEESVLSKLLNAKERSMSALQTF
jgi:hypothetical protein